MLGVALHQRQGLRGLRLAWLGGRVHPVDTSARSLRAAARAVVLGLRAQLGESVSLPHGHRASLWAGEPPLGWEGDPGDRQESR